MHQYMVIKQEDVKSLKIHKIIFKKTPFRAGHLWSNSMEIKFRNLYYSIQVNGRQHYFPRLTIFENCVFKISIYCYFPFYIHCVSNIATI